MSGDPNQVRHCRALLASASSIMREAIAQLNLLPNTTANHHAVADASDIEEDIRKLEAKVMDVNWGAFQSVAGHEKTGSERR